MQARAAAFVVWEVVAEASATTDADLFRLAVAVDAVLVTLAAWRSATRRLAQVGVRVFWQCTPTLAATAADVAHSQSLPVGLCFAMRA